MQYLLYNQVLSILCSVLDGYSSVLFLSAPGTAENSPRKYFVAASFSLGQKVDKDVQMSEGKGLVGWLLHNQEPLLVANFDQRQNHLGYYKDNEELTIKAFMGCPLPGGKGAICIDSKRQYSFSEKDQKFLYLFAGLIADMLANIDTSDKLRETMKYYNALHKVYDLRHKHTRWNDFLHHFLTLMVDVTGFSYCVLCTRDAYGENYTVEAESKTLFIADKGENTQYPMTNGLIGWVFRNGTPVLGAHSEGSPDSPLIVGNRETPNFKTVMAIPLVIQRKTRGVLCLAHDEHLVVSEAGKDFVRMAAEHLSLFLENLYVKCRLRDIHQRIS